MIVHSDYLLSVAESSFPFDIKNITCDACEGNIKNIKNLRKNKQIQQIFPVEKI
jgi:hypothetical protein